jgi:hypothetical protein
MLVKSMLVLLSLKMLTEKTIVQVMMPPSVIVHSLLVKSVKDIGNVQKLLKSPSKS